MSIIMGLYNSQSFLARCLESVVGQTLKDIEIILVDDGSRDGTLDIARSFAAGDRRIRILRHEENRGQSAALNTGFEAASGTTVRFIDNDDYLPLDSSEILADVYARHRPDVVRGHATLIEDGVFKEAGWIPRPTETHGTRFGECEQLWRYLGGVWRHLFDRRFLVKNNILHDKDIRIGQDHIFNSRAYTLADSISVIENAVYYYDFLSESSLTRPKNLRDRAYVDEAAALVKTSINLRPYPVPYLIDLTFHVGYRFHVLQEAVIYLDRPAAMTVLSKFAEIYAPIDLASARGILEMLNHKPPKHSERVAAIAERLHRGEIGPLYDWLGDAGAH